MKPDLLGSLADIGLGSSWRGDHDRAVYARRYRIKAMELTVALYDLCLDLIEKALTRPRHVEQVSRR